jgi:hypothetical protein
MKLFIHVQCDFDKHESDLLQILSFDLNPVLDIDQAQAVLGAKRVKRMTKFTASLSLSQNYDRRYQLNYVLSSW